MHFSIVVQNLLQFIQRQSINKNHILDEEFRLHAFGGYQTQFLKTLDSKNMDYLISFFNIPRIDYC
jgi:hypothetical protein